MKKNKTIDLCVIALNEEKVIKNLLEDFANQDYSHKLIEIILVDSMSTDKTKIIFNKFKEKYKKDFKNIKVLDNPKKILAAGWNVVINNANEDIIVRVDAHSSIPKDFVSKNVKLHDQGEKITGGPRPNIIVDKTNWLETLLLAETSMFGSSIAPYRRNSSTNIKYVNSLFHGAYDKKVIDDVGLFNESLGRTEDNEYNYRIRKKGYKLCYCEDIISYQHIRTSLRKMLKQKYMNGYWIGLTVYKCPKCLELYHFIPFCFILGILLTTIMFILKLPFLGYIMWSLYIILTILMTIIGVISRKKFLLSDLLLPFIFFLLHISYGIGTLVGLVKGLFRRGDL